MGSLEKAREAVAHFSEIEGMMSEEAAYAFIFLFEVQQRASISGHIFESGVYKGKSASLLCSYAEGDEKVTLVDIGYQNECSHLSSLHPHIDFLKSKSEELQENYPNICTMNDSCRIFHADGSHTFDNVLNDIKLANQLLKQDGLLILDDFLSPAYPQVQAATYYYLCKHPDQFDVFLIGENKAFLTRPEFHKFYINECLASFIDRMEVFGHDFSITVSDINPNFDAVSFRKRKGEKHYLSRLYAKNYELRA